MRSRASRSGTSPDTSNVRASTRSVRADSTSSRCRPRCSSALGLIRFRRGQIADRPAWLPWSLRAVVLREPQRVMVGYANFHGPPGVNDLGAADAAETGYTIFAAHRGQGFATELAQAMMDWAAREHGVRHFISGVAPDNAPSLRVNDKLGFVRTGDVVDGEMIFELRRR